MANEFIIKKGLISKANSVISGSLIVTEGISGSFQGNGSGLTNVTASFSPTASYALTASYVNPLNQDVEITGSLAVNGDITAAVTDTARLGITLKPSTGVVGATQFAKIQDSNGNDIITRQQGTVNRPHELWIGRNTGYQGDNNIIINGPGNIGSPSFNQTNLGVTSLWVWQGANTYGQYITGRTQDATSTALLVRNWNGSSGVPNYETYFQLRNDKSVLISGSLEVTGSVIVTEGVSGSFSGSFEGDGSGLTNIPAVSPFPFTGDASITGSLTISGSFNAFRLNTTDVILGEGAGALSTINGPRNVMVGYQAGYTNTSGDDNVAVGYKAGYGLHNNASDANVFIGKLSGAGGTSGTARMSNADNNIGIGVQSLLFLTSGGFNIGIGYFAMRNIGSGTYNLALGNNTLFNTSTGQHNIGIGYQAGFNQTTGDGNITIGSGSLGIAGESNQLRIGNGESVTVISASLATGDIIFASTASAAYFVGDGSQLTNLQRPISSSISTDITASNLNAGYYFRVGGNVTCSIQSSSFISCDVGSEFEFFQTSSAGNMLFLSGSGVTLNSKSGNITLTGQFSAATLKKVDNDEWDLIGDLS